MEAKSKLANAALLHHPNPFSSTCLTVDASEVAVGAELAQRGGRDLAWRPVAFFSHKLTGAEKKYSAFDRELLAVYLSVKHFRHFLEGKPFTVFTDHKPLTHALVSVTDNRSPRQTRHLSFISEFTSDIRHIKGQNNIVADTLSRPSVTSVSFPEIPSVDFAAVAAAQDPGGVLGDSSLDLALVSSNGQKMWCDTAGGRIRPLVPQQFRRPVFEVLHGLSHAGTRPTTKLISNRFVWPGMRKEIRAWCRSCMPCQTSKVARHTKSPVMVLPPAQRRFDLSTWTWSVHFRIQTAAVICSRSWIGLAAGRRLFLCRTWPRQRAVGRLSAIGCRVLASQIPSLLTGDLNLLEVPGRN